MCSITPITLVTPVNTHRVPLPLAEGLSTGVVQGLPDVLVQFQDQQSHGIHERLLLFGHLSGTDKATKHLGLILV